MEENKWILYCHTSQDGKKYIGITSNKPNRRWDNGRGYKSNALFYNYIKKNGWHTIKHEILFTNLTEKKAKELEKYYIRLYKTQNKLYGFNLTAGGDSGFSPNEETRKKLSLARKKRIISQETRIKLSNSLKGENNGFYGKHHTEEARRKISEAHKGKEGIYKDKHLSEEHKKKIGLKSLYRNAKELMCVETGKKYRCVREVLEEYNFKSESSIHACCNGKRKSAYGLHWQYVKI